MFKYLTLIFILMGCGKFPSDVKDRKGSPPRHTTNPIFQPYVDKFNSELKVHSTVPVIFGEMDSKYAGLCYKWTNGYREVVIWKGHWDLLGEEQKEQLIFHELGHCKLDKGHNNRNVIIGGDTCPESVMKDTAFSVYEVDNCYKMDYNHYISELGR